VSTHGPSPPSSLTSFPTRRSSDLFKLVARNAGGPGEGSNQEFKTLEEVIPPMAPTVETKPASSITTTGATLNGTVNPNGSAVTEGPYDTRLNTPYRPTAHSPPSPS